MDLTDIKGIGPKLAETLRREGIHTVEQVRAIDVKPLAKKTGIPEDRLRSWKRQAEKLFTESVETTASALEKTTDLDAMRHEAERVAGQAVRKAEELRVVLKEQANTAAVRLGEKTWEGLPIIAAKIQESEEELMRSARRNAVLLKERADTAWVKIEGELHKNVPIFKEKWAEAEKGAEKALKEVRVMVEEIREKAPEPLKEGEAGLRRMFDRVMGKNRK